MSKNLGVVYGMMDKHQENCQLLYRFEKAKIRDLSQNYVKKRVAK